MAARAVGILLLASAGLALRATPGAVTVRQARRRVAAPPICCICINCKWVERCETYHWVEQQHEQPHLTDTPDFEPDDPQIQVFLRTEKTSDDAADAAAAAAEAEAAAADADGGVATIGMDMFDTHTVEYDVFGCDAYAEEKGRWVRLMPDAGFVPT